MKSADHKPELNSQETPTPDPAVEASSELDDRDLDAVAGGISWHLPKDPVSTTWDEEADL